MQGQIPAGAQQVPFYAFYSFDKALYGRTFGVAKHDNLTTPVEGGLQTNSRQHMEIAIDLWGLNIILKSLLIPKRVQSS
jgi:hypothetical protein